MSKLAIPCRRAWSAACVRLARCSFGIVYIDYTTQRRIPKDSALWLRQMIPANAVEELPVWKLGCCVLTVKIH